jgi:hypothetical protein
MPSVTWVLTSGKYEVSSIDHLMCIATQGTGYTCSGSVPSNYMTVSYIQTANIDCTGKTMIPIPNFYGSYNGNYYEIQNWQNNQSSTDNDQALFSIISPANGTAWSNSIEKIKMTGTIKVKGYDEIAVLVGMLNEADVKDCIIIFGQSSTINGRSICGSVVGRNNSGDASKAHIFNIKVSGSVNITCSGDYIGGIMGMLSGWSGLTDCENSITGDITGRSYVAGIIGYSDLNGVTSCINKMTGNIIGTGNYIAGICSYQWRDGSLYGSYPSGVNYCLNMMTGSITGVSYVSGIVSYTVATINNNVNMMKGNIVCTNSTYSSGIGYNTNKKYSNNLLAITGNVPTLLCNEKKIAASMSQNYYSNTFGMTVNNVTLTSDSNLLVIKINITGFPYQLWSNTIQKMWEPNILVPYPVYKYTITDGSFRESRFYNNNIPNQTLSISGLTTSGVTLTWVSISGYSYYRIILNTENSSDVIIVSSTTNLTTTLTNLISGTSYTCSLFISNDNTTFIDSCLRTVFKPSDKTTLTRTTITSTSFNFSWTSVNGITNYRILNKDTSEILGATTSTSLTCNLTEYSYYTFMLEGSNDNINFERISSLQTYTTYPLISWLIDSGTGYYIVSSINHLIAITTNGGIYIQTTGTYPTNYLTSSYIQTVDIDCTGYVMIPIGDAGNGSNSFDGNYYGQNHKISNWQNSQSTTSDYQGIFGLTGGGNTKIIKDLTIDGIIKLYGNTFCGIVVGQCSTSIYNITVNCLSGSIVSCGKNSNSRGVGGVIGYLDVRGAYNLSITGTVNINGGLANSVGGVIGLYCQYNNPPHTYELKNSITGNINGVNYVGGIIGNSDNAGGYNYSGVIGALNTMTGNITGSASYVGGIMGWYSNSFGTGIAAITNAMTGNISGTDYVGGITGSMYGGTSDIINIMIGNITTSNNSTSGALGYGLNTCTRSLIAMKGNTPSLVVGTTNGTAGNYYFTFSSRFGMTVNNVTLLTITNNVTYITLDSYPTTELSTGGYIAGNWDSLNNLPYWRVTYTNNGVSRVFSGQILTSRYTIPINWTLNNSNYEISSFYHLATLLQNGVPFSNTTTPTVNQGSIPSNWFNVNYIQKSNIDFTGINMCNLNSSLCNFSGIYDGNNKEIQNLLYNSSNNSINNSLFMCLNNATIKNIKLTGSLNVYGSNATDRGKISYGGIVYACSNNNIISNCEVKTTGTILTNDSISLICNNMVGSNNIINNCSTNYIGLIDTNCSNILKPSGIILGNSTNLTTNYVIHCTNSNIGDNYLGKYYGGGIVGSNCTVLSSINLMKGNLKGLSSNVYYNCGGIVGTGIVKNSVNSMIGNLGDNNGSYISGISSGGRIDHCINNMIGNLEGSGISYNGIVTNSLNYMIGSNYDTIGGDILYSSNNFIGQNGLSVVSNKNYIDYYYTDKYNFINSNNYLKQQNDIWNKMKSDNIFEYYNGIDLPVLRSNISYTINNSNYNITASNWSINLPNTINDYNELKILYNTTNSNYTIYKKNLNNSITNTVASINSNNIPIIWSYNNNNYEISSDLHLKTLLNNGITPLIINTVGYYINSNNYPLNWLSSSYKQINNINLNNLNLISLSDINFTGIYDGDNKEIQNLLYSHKGTDINCGLFKNINGATLKNITLTGSLNIYGNNLNDRGTISYGCIVHTAQNNNLIENCKIIASGIINTNSNISLICNQITGSNNIINKCYTNYTGTINTNCSNNPSGIFLGKGYRNDNSYVLYSTNENVGNNMLGNYYSGGIIGTNATVFGCINKSIGNLDGLNCGGIAGNAKVVNCINNMTGDIGNSSLNVSGISGNGEISYSINNMKGNLNTNSSYGISKDGKVTNSLNYMYGDVYDAIGGNIITSSNNYCALRGQVNKVHNSFYKKYFGNTLFGLSNNTANIPIKNDVWNLYTINNSITYYEDIDLPVLPSNIYININNLNYYGLASNWEISFVNNSNFNEFSFKYDIDIEKYKLYKTTLTNSNIITIPYIADGSSPSSVPTFLLSFVGESGKSDYRSNLDNILATNSNIKSLEEASIFSSFTSLIVQPNSNEKPTIDLSSMSSTLDTYKSVYQSAIKNVLQNAITEEKMIITNIDNSVLFDNVVKERNVEKLYVKPEATLDTSDVDSLFSNKSDLLLLESTVYSLNLNGPILTIDTSKASTCNYVDINFNNSNFRLDSSNSFVNLEISPGIWKGFELNSMGSGGFNGFEVIDLTYSQDELNNYLITNSNELYCFMYNGYGYRITNPSFDLLTANYLQKSNIDLGGELNLIRKGIFKGIYNGSNNEIKNLEYQNIGTSTNLALFENIEGGVIKNLSIIGNLNIGGSNNTIGNISYGGFVYTANNNSIIENCKVKASGIIDIDGSLSLICNNIIGSNCIINNCLTEYYGNIKTTNTLNSSGIILGNGFGVDNSYVLYCINSNVGNSYLGSQCGVLVGSNATIIGSVNRIQGNFNGLEGNESSYIGGIIGSGKAIGCVNEMIGNLFDENTSLSGGIVGNGTAQNCINCMIGNISGSNTVGSIGNINSSLSNCLNVMKGNTKKAIGGNNNNNNICAMYGNPDTIELNSNNYGIIDYGLNNSISQLELINLNNIQNYLPSNDYFNYMNDFELPYIKANLSFNSQSAYTVNNIEKWYILYPNIIGNTSSKGLNGLNLYAIRGDNKLLKFRLFEYDTLLSLIFNYNGKSYQFNFEWDDKGVTENIKFGIGTNSPSKTLDINGDINLTGNLYKNYNQIGLWYEINSSNLMFTEDTNIGIGKTDPSYKIDINGIINANSYLTVSDIRLKENIIDENLGLDFINSLKPKTFNLINSHTANSNRHGFIAQDFETIEQLSFIEKDNYDMLSIKMNSLLSPIIKSLQELDIIIK